MRVDLKRVDDWVFIYLLKTELISSIFVGSPHTGYHFTCAAANMVKEGVNNKAS